MSNLTLDGNISYIGTEFIKLLNTGTSHLATEEYVDNAVGNGGGGSGDGYTQAEVDALLNNKLNVNNPQDIIGNLRLDPTNGNSKIILNAVSPPNANDDFYCNGNGHFNGTLRVSVLTSDGDVNCDGVNGNTFNVNNTNTKISFNDDAFEYMKYENSNVDATFYGLKVLSNLYTMDVYPQSIRLPYNNKIAFIDTDGGTDGDYYNDNYINITIDGGIQRLNQVIMGNGEHRFYVGDIATADDGDLVMKLSNTRIDIYKDLYLNDVLFQQGGGNSGTFNEDVVIADTFQLKTDTISSNGLNDLVFNVDTVGEFLRFQVSDNTVRVPNTRSFLSQDIYLDNLRPLTFSNDVVLNGGNSTNDAYEEYVRLDASAERMIVSKATKFENNIQFNVGQNISWTNVFIREVFSSRPEFDLIVNGSTSHLRLWVNGSVKQAITNTTIACKVNIDAEQGITVFNGQQLITNTVNSHTNSDLLIQRSGSTAIILKAGNEVDFSGYVNINNISTENDTDMAIRRNDIEFIRLFKDGTTSAEAIFCYKQLRATQGFKATTIDTENVNDNLDFQRNGSSYMVFNSDRININQPLHLAGTLFIDTVNKLSLKPSLESGVNIFDIRNLHPVADNPMIRYRVGEGGGETIVCEMTNDRISFQRNVLIGTAYELQTNAIDTVNDNDLVFNRNNIPFLTLDKFTEDTVEKEAIICSKQLRANGNILVNNLQINQFPSGVEYTDFRLHNADSVMRFYVGNSTNANFQITHAGITLNRETTIGSVKTNTINSNGDNDLVFQRDGTEIFKIETSAGIDNNNILNITPISGGMSASNVYCNSFKNRTLTSDTIFFGSNSAGDNRTEYMKWNRTDQSLDFNAPIDNTNIAVIGNIVDTTVSDERLKTNIQDVESNYCDCVKNVKIKTFEYKDEKYKNSDKYGFIAQHLQKHLPKEFNNIVKETKPKKDEGEAYLSINYMKLSVVLWGALQETLNKVEHLESRLFEAEDEIKALKGKGKGEAKPKAKSKSKAKNVD